MNIKNAKGDNMEEKWDERTEILIGRENINKLNKSKVIIYGIGGVGSFATEGLARAGVGNIVLVDNDIVSITNLNRQIHSNITTIGKDKVEVMKERILQINPKCNVEIYNPTKIDVEEENLIDESMTYVVDAIDTFSQKIKIILKAHEKGIPIISGTSAGNKMNPNLFQVSDIYNTSVCPVCRLLRKELKKNGIKKHKVIYSKEEPIRNKERMQNIGSISFVPSIMGLMIAGEVIKEIINK